MKRFILRTSVLLLIIVVVDIVLGAMFQGLVKSAKGGDTGRMEYICHKTNEQLLVFGSSRAMYHYDPEILEDSLGLTCYNCGKEGNGIILLYGRYRLMKKHYQPCVILYDVEPGFDLQEGDNSRFLASLRYYYHETPIDSIFWSVDKNERYKMSLASYRFNTQFLQLIMDNVMPMRQDTKGYRPLQGEMTYEPVEREALTEYKYDPLKLFYLERFIVDCKNSGTKLIFAVSPKYKNASSDVLQPLKKLCQRYNLPLIDHYSDETFNLERSYFKESEHMNERGATAYTQLLVKELRPLINTLNCNR